MTGVTSECLTGAYSYCSWTFATMFLPKLPFQKQGFQFQLVTKREQSSIFFFFLTIYIYNLWIARENRDATMPNNAVETLCSSCYNSLEENKYHGILCRSNTVQIMKYFYFNVVTENNRFTSKRGGTKHIRYTHLVTAIKVIFLGGTVWLITDDMQFFSNNSKLLKGL